MGKGKGKERDREGGGCKREKGKGEGARGRKEGGKGAQERKERAKETHRRRERSSDGERQRTHANRIEAADGPGRPCLYLLAPTFQNTRRSIRRWSTHLKPSLRVCSAPPHSLYVMMRVHQRACVQRASGGREGRGHVVLRRCAAPCQTGGGLNSQTLPPCPSLASRSPCSILPALDPPPLSALLLLPMRLWHRFNARAPLRRLRPRPAPELRRVPGVSALRLVSLHRVFRDAQHVSRHHSQDL